MHSVPVSEPLALIRQNQRQTPVVESLQNTKFCKLSVTDVPRLNCYRKCPTSQIREICIKVCLSSSLTLYLCNLNLHLVHNPVFFILPVRNIISFGILYELQNCTAHQLVALVFIKVCSTIRMVLDHFNRYLLGLVSTYFNMYLSSNRRIYNRIGQLFSHMGCADNIPTYIFSFKHFIIDDINYQLNFSIYVATGGHCYATLIKTDVDLIAFNRLVYREIQLITLTLMTSSKARHLR